MERLKSKVSFITAARFSQIRLYSILHIAS